MEPVTVCWHRLLSFAVMEILSSELHLQVRALKQHQRRRAVAKVNGVDGKHGEEQWIRR